MLDASIPLSGQVMQLDDPLERQAKVASLSQMAMQNRYMQSKMDAEGRTANLSNMRGQAYMQSGGDPKAVRAALMNNGDYEGLIAHDKSQVEAQKAQGEIDSQKAGLAGKYSELEAKAAQGVIAAGGTPESVQYATRFLRAGGHAGGADHLLSMQQQYPNATPEDTIKYVSQFTGQGMSSADFNNPNYKDTGGELTQVNRFSSAPSINKTQTPESLASNALTKRGQDLQNARSVESNKTAQEGNTLIGGKQSFEAEHKLADDHKTESKTFIDLRDGYTRIRASLGNATKSAAATLAGATSFMKLLDPGSVVRESELGMALAASGVIDRAANYYNTLSRGKVLTESQAADFKKISEQIYKAAEANQDKLDAQYTEKAKGYGLKPENVVKDYRAKVDAPAGQPKVGSVVDGFRFKGGDPSKQTSWERTR